MLAWLKKLSVVSLWILIWQLIAVAIHNEILLASPVQTVVALSRGVSDTAFWSSIVFSMSRILLGFASAFVLGLVVGAISWRFKLFGELLTPAVTFVKSVPIVCFIVMLLIWLGARWVSLTAVILVAFPPVYFSTIEGLVASDQKLNEMLKIFQVGGVRKLLSYYWPSILPFVQAASKTAVGMSWKSGIAAELIGLPSGSIGEGIYRAKILLNSADLFSWTLVVVVISVITEFVFMWLLERSDDWAWRFSLPKTVKRSSTPKGGHSGYSGHSGHRSGTAAAAVIGSGYDTGVGNPSTTTIAPTPIVADSISKAFGSNQVFNSISFTLDPGGRYALVSPSGTGKTTLLRVLARLDFPDSGTLKNANQVSVVFQEARMFEKRSSLDNLRLTVGLAVTPAEIRATLMRLLPEDSLDIPVDQLSGGMRRRVELCRALLKPCQLLLLDEPFAGLDSDNTAIAQELLLSLLGGRTLVIVSHDLRDIELLQAAVLSPFSG